MTAVGFAQQTDEQSVTELDEVVVTVGRQTQMQSEASAPVSVVDREEITRRQARSIDDLLRDAPGVTISGGPRRDAPRRAWNIPSGE